MFELNRQLIELKGDKVFNFLQGLVTIDVSNMSEGNCKYGLILTPQGRYRNDIFIFIKKGGNVILDCGGKDNVLDYLKKYRVGYDILMRDISNKFSVYSSYEKNADISFPDVRNLNMGYRNILEKGSGVNDKDKNYLKNRVKNCVIECCIDMEIEKSYPIEYGLHYAIDFEKGCYIGQEVTTKINLMGDPKNDIYEIKILDCEECIDIGNKIYCDNVNIGRILSNIDGKGMMLAKKRFVNKYFDEGRNFECCGYNICLKK